MMMAHQLDGVLCTSYKQRICSNKEKIMMEHTAGNYNLIIITLSAFELQRGASQNYLFDLGNFPCHFHYLLGTWCSKGNWYSSVLFTDARSEPKSREYFAQDFLIMGGQFWTPDPQSGTLSMKSTILSEPEWAKWWTDLTSLVLCELNRKSGRLFKTEQSREERRGLLGWMVGVGAMGSPPLCVSSPLSRTLCDGTIAL